VIFGLAVLAAVSESVISECEGATHWQTLDETQMVE